MQLPAAAALLTAAFLLPLASPLPQLSRDPDTTPDTGDNDIGPRYMFGGWRGNEVWPSSWQPREWGRPPFFRPLGWRPGPPPPPPPPGETISFVPFEAAPPATSRPTTTSAGGGATVSRGCDCPATSEFNPVCGTDHVSYPNPGRLHCARECGKRVEIYHMGNCMTTTARPSRGEK